MKKALHYILTILVFAGAFAAIIFIVREETDFLFESLYIRTSLLRAGGLYNKIIRRLTLAIILYVIGVAGILIGVMTGEFPGFFRLARIAAAFSAIVISVWDYNVISMLPVSHVRRYLWSWIGDVGHVACLLAILSLSANVLMSETQAGIIRKLNLVMAGIFVAADLVQLPYQGRLVLLALALYAAVISAWMLVDTLRNAKLTDWAGTGRSRITTLIFLLTSAGGAAAVLFISRCKFRPLSRWYNTYLKIYPTLGAACIGAFFLAYFLMYWRRAGLRRAATFMLVQRSAREVLQTRLNFLQSQINPHFIFNTLSSILPLCIKEPEKAYEMLSNFSEYLRGRLYKRELQNTVPVYEEMDLIEAFLSIEQMRFPGLIEYELVNESGENSRILPLLIEPIVENSAQHGRKTGELMTIRVSVQERGGFLYCQVEDDGRGMTAERLTQIESDTDDADAAKNSSIGIYNVRRRLLLYYNETMKIASTPDKGTTVSFRVPVRE